MQLNQNTFTEPVIITKDELKHRSYVTFYFNNERIREYNGESINLDIKPNRADNILEKQRLLQKLRFELHKALDANIYPSPKDIPSKTSTEANAVSTLPAVTEAKNEPQALYLLFNAIRNKLRSALSRTYKRDLKSVYRDFRSFMTSVEHESPILTISTARIEKFLSQYGSSGTYYMNKRRNLGVLFSAAGRSIDKPIKAVKETPRRKIKAKLHEKYSVEQLKPILNYLKVHYPNLYRCCLLTYGSWLRPHEEIRLLTAGDFYNNYTEVHLSGDENKGGKVRVVYIPDYVQNEIVPIIKQLDRNDNIFSLQPEPYNYSYFNTQWSRAYKKMFEIGLVFEDQTIYSFRHTAAVSLYRRTKDVYLLQKLLGHSSIVVTLKYLRTLGELNSEELRQAAPQLEY